MKNAYLGIVQWNDPTFHLAKEAGEIKGKSQSLLTKQENVGYITEDGDNLVVINAVTGKDTYDLTVIPKSLVKSIRRLYER